jgi:hypothetical protein
MARSRSRGVDPRHRRAAEASEDVETRPTHQQPRERAPARSQRARFAREAAAPSLLAAMFAANAGASAGAGACSHQQRLLAASLGGLLADRRPRARGRPPARRGVRLAVSPLVCHPWTTKPDAAPVPADRPSSAPSDSSSAARKQQACPDGPPAAAACSRGDRGPPPPLRPGSAAAARLLRQLHAAGGAGPASPSGDRTAGGARSSCSARSTPARGGRCLGQGDGSASRSSCNGARGNWDDEDGGCDLDGSGSDGDDAAAAAAAATARVAEALRRALLTTACARDGVAERLEQMAALSGGGESLLEGEASRDGIDIVSSRAGTAPPASAASGCSAADALGAARQGRGAQGARQVAPMVLNLEEPSRSSREVLELELSRLGLAELRALAAALGPAAVAP